MSKEAENNEKLFKEQMDKALNEWISKKEADAAWERYLEAEEISERIRGTVILHLMGISLN